MKLHVEYLKKILRASDKWGVSGLLLLSLAANIYQGRELLSRPKPAPASTLATGTRLSNIDVENLDGSKTTIDWKSSKPTLLYVFSPSCGWCKRNFDNFASVNRARREQYRIIGLSITSVGLKQYVHDHALDYAVYGNPKSQEFARLGTPATLLVSGDGTIEELWRGAYTGRTKDRVEARFKLQLPGLTGGVEPGSHAE